MQTHKAVIVGAGAGGLELAARLGRQFGPEHVLLVDQSPTHIWKPSLHEVAAGTLDIHREGLSYAMLARDCGYAFVQGEVSRVDRDRRLVHVQAVVEQGIEVFRARTIAYDTLVMAVGSRTHFFGTPGAREHALALDTTEQAERFRRLFLRKLMARGQDDAPGPLDVIIVGGGATGVELAAELVEARKNLGYYGLDTLDPAAVRITLLEGAPRILSALPEKMSAAALQLLQQRGIVVHTGVRVASVGPQAVRDTQDVAYPCDLCVWAAGIEAPAWLETLGLQVNGVHQLVVDERLRTSDAHIYALGDCAQAPWPATGGHLPARAQVAHQQASYLRKVLARRIRGQADDGEVFRYRDYGSLVSVGHSRGVGSLMGVLSGKSWFVEGLVARLMYMSLHLLHHMAVLGLGRTAAMALGRLLLRRSAPRVKLH